MKWYTIVTLRSVEGFTLARGGRVVWDGLAASCEACGCDIHDGRRTAESDRELAARLGGKRSKVSEGELPCANCGKRYAVKAAA